MTATAYGRKIKIGLTQSGHFFIFDKPRDLLMAGCLPVFTVDSTEEAVNLRSISCEKIPRKPEWVINKDAGFDGHVETIDKVTAYLMARYKILKTPAKA